MLLALLGLLGIVGMGGNVRRGVYVLAVALVIALTALWLSVTAMRRARAAGTSRPRGSVFATVTGIIGILFGGMMLVTIATFWPQFTQLSQCMSTAGTVAAQQACEQQFQDSMGNMFSVLGK